MLYILLEICYNIFIKTFKEKEMTQNSKKMFLVLAFLFLVVTGSVIYFSTYDGSKDNNMVGIVVQTEEEMNHTVDKMKAKGLSCEFIVYKYNEERLLEMFLGFWPTEINASEKMRKEYTKKSWGMIYEFIDNNATSNVDFIVKHKPQ